jgi:hypothetical protein
VAVDCGQAHAAVVHLSCEDLVAEEVVAEDAAVAVGTVDALVSGHIRQVSQQSVHAVVLLLDIVQVLSMSIDGVVPEYPLQQQEGVEVFMLPAGRVIEHSHV